MSVDIFNRLHDAFDAQMPPEPRYREPTEAEIVERTAKVLAAWKDDEAKFIETVADVICMASPAFQAELASLAHCGDAAAFGDAVIAKWQAAWKAEGRQRAEDELAGVV